MPASSPRPLDDVDRALVARLQTNGRTPAAALARDLRIDQRTVARRVQGLLDDGIIRIAAVTDPRFLGYGSMALVCMSLKSLDPARVYEEVARIPEVDYVSVTTGRFALQAEVMCADDEELRRVLRDTFRRIRDIDSMEVLYYLRLHFQRAWFTEGGSRSLAGIRPLELDDTDRALVAALAGDGRLTFEALATRLGISETTIRLRYNALNASGAMRVVAIANPLHIGFAAACWVAITTTPAGRVTEVAESLTAIDEVSYVAITAGSIDIIAEVVCRNHEHLIALMDSRIRPIDGVERAEVWMYLDLEYKPLLPR